MLARLFLLFTLIPSVELWLLFQVKEQLGLFETIWLVLFTGVLGASMAKNQGIKVLQDLQTSQKSGQQISATLLEGVLILVGGVLLVTPGILTDLFGFSLIIPFTRKLWVPLLRSWASQNIQAQVSGSAFHTRDVENAHTSASPFQGFSNFSSDENSTAQTKQNTDTSTSMSNSSTPEIKTHKGFSHPQF